MPIDHDIKLNSFYCSAHGLINNPIFDAKISSVKISSIKRVKNDYWLVEGFGDARCPKYSAICCSIISDLKIQCEPFSCPICGQKEDLNFKINNIRTDNTSFEFEAEIICEKCNKKRSLKK